MSKSSGDQLVLIATPSGVLWFSKVYGCCIECSMIVLGIPLYHFQGTTPAHFRNHSTTDHTSKEKQPVETPCTLEVSYTLVGKHSLMSGLWYHSTSSVALIIGSVSADNQAPSSILAICLTQLTIYNIINFDIHACSMS